MSLKHLYRILGYVAYRWSRWMAPRHASVDIDGMRFEIDAKTDIGFNLYRNRAFEFDEILAASAMCLARFQGQKFAILDVGANIGIHSLFLARACHRAQIFAFEPAPATFLQLRAHIQNNGFSERITPVNIALSDANGTATFFVTSDNAYNGLKDTNRKELRQTLEVPTRTLDDWVETNTPPPIGLIKIDVEGLEHQVIAGAHRTLARHFPLIAIEIFGGTDSNTDPDATIRAIIDQGYEAYIVDGGLLKPFVPPHRDAYYNYFFLPTGNRNAK
jgi:FkbM family methyltransferase